MKNLKIQMLQYGPPSVLQPVEATIPEPGSDEVLVEAIASGVNRADCEIRSGHWPIQTSNPFPYTPGLEVMGRVVRAGEASKFNVGEIVITMMQKLGGIHGIRPGGYQSHVLVPARTLARVPPEVDPLEIAKIGLAGVTALHGLKKLALKQGSRVIIQGASGGVGSIAIQLAKQLGAHVIVPDRTGKKASVLRELGADEIWDLTRQPWEKYAANRVDAVLEMVGGEMFEKSVAALKRGGRLCSVGALTGGPASLSVWDLLQDLVLTGWSSENMDRAELQQAIDELSELLKQGEISAPPTRCLSLLEAARAHELLESGASVGRILLVVGSPSDHE